MNGDRALHRQKHDRARARQVLEDSVRHQVINHNVAADSQVLVRDERPHTAPK
jgi:hypothetical protein